MLRKLGIKLVFILTHLENYKCQVNYRFNTNLLRYVPLGPYLIFKYIYVIYVDMACIFIVQEDV